MKDIKQVEDNENPFSNGPTKKQGQKRTFIHRVLGPSDLIGDLKFAFYEWWYGTVKKHDSATAEKMAWDSLSEG